jgi:VCBS repeat-containing protein
MPEDLKRTYYDNSGFVTITGNNGDIDNAFLGAATSSFVESISDTLGDLINRPGQKSIIGILVKSITGEFIVEKIEAEFNPSTQRFELDGNDVVNIAGTSAVSAAILGISSLFPPATAFVGASVLAAAGASYIWSSIAEGNQTLQSIADFIAEIGRSARGSVPVDIQLLGSDGSVLGGVVYEDEVSPEQELQAINDLLVKTTSTSFPNPVIGQNTIRVVERTGLFPQDRKYSVYDGKLVDAITEELGVTKDELLSFGEANSPNTNSQIYSDPKLLNAQSFVFTSDENRFFVPLPDVSGNTSLRAFHPGNIIVGDENNNNLDAFGDTLKNKNFTNQGFLIIGLDGDDTIKGLDVGLDVMIGGRGNDFIADSLDNTSTSNGKDIVVFSDRFKNYDYSVEKDGKIIFSHVRGTQEDGVDTLENIEYAQFADRLVKLPLDAETESLLDSLKDSVTFRFGTTIGRLETGFGEDKEILAGAFGPVPFILEYSFDPNLPDLNKGPNASYSPVSGFIKVGNESTTLRDGWITVGQDTTLLGGDVIDFYSIEFREGGLLFGRTIDRININFVDDSGEMFAPPSEGGFALPLTSDFVQEVDELGITFELDPLPAKPGDSFTDVFFSDVEFFRRASVEGGVGFSLTSDLDEPPNSEPLAADDIVATSVNLPLVLSFEDLLINDSDPDGDELTVTGADNAVNGTVEVKDNEILFLPTLDFEGEARFEYTISDTSNSTATATVLIAIEEIIGSLSAVDDSFNTEEDSLLLGNVIDNDVIAGESSFFITLLDNVSNGSLTLNIDGSFEYISNVGFSGIDQFTYEISDAFDQNSTATVELNVIPSNSIPDAISDEFIIDEDSSISGNVLSNDADVGSSELTAQLVSDPSFGNLQLSDDGSFIYTPEPDYSGIDSFTYVAFDGVTSSLPTTVSFTINPINDAPNGVGDSYTLDEDNSTNGNVLDNDTDIDSSELDATLVSGPSFGALQFSDDGSFTYTPDNNYFGADSFIYKVSDGTSESFPTTVNIVINPVNDDPVAQAQTFSLNKNTPLTISIADLLKDATDGDGDIPTFDSFSHPNNGSIVNNNDGTITYVPDDDYVGSDGFTYAIKDGNDGTAVATISLKIEAVDNPPDPVNNSDPITSDDQFATGKDTLLAGNVLENDSDPNSDSLTASIVSGPNFGSLNLSEDGSFTYQPNPDFSGIDAFTYKVLDGKGGEVTAAAQIIVYSQVGTSGTDFITGTSSDDVLVGAQGRDILTGGAGSDWFIYESILDRGDIINDFQAGQDKIVMTDLIATTSYSESPLGLTPIEQGYLQFLGVGSDSYLMLDLDGNNGPGNALPFLVAKNIEVGEFSDSDNFIF